MVDGIATVITCLIWTCLTFEFAPSIRLDGMLAVSWPDAVLGQSVGSYIFHAG